MRNYTPYCIPIKSISSLRMVVATRQSARYLSDRDSMSFGIEQQPQGRTPSTASNLMLAGEVFPWREGNQFQLLVDGPQFCPRLLQCIDAAERRVDVRSEEHTSELQSRENLVC